MVVQHRRSRHSASADERSVRRAHAVERSRIRMAESHADGAADQSAVTARSARTPKRVRVPLLPADVASCRGGADRSCSTCDRRPTMLEWSAPALPRCSRSASRSTSSFCAIRLAHESAAWPAPAAVLFAWLAGRLVRHWAGRLALVLLLACVVASLSGVAEWRRRLRFEESIAGRVTRMVTVMAATPPLITTLPNAHLWGLVAYLRECTGPADRVFAPAFLPELYFFAQRGFAGGVVATFGGHWSEPRFERRIVDALSSQSVPIVIFESGDMQAFAATYPALDRYVREHYVEAGESTFEGSGRTPLSPVRPPRSTSRSPPRSPLIAVFCGSHRGTT